MGTISSSLSKKKNAWTNCNTLSLFILTEDNHKAKGIHQTSLCSLETSFNTSNPGPWGLCPFSMPGSEQLFGKMVWEQLYWSIFVFYSPLKVTGKLFLRMKRQDNKPGSVPEVLARAPGNNHSYREGVSILTISMSTCLLLGQMVPSLLRLALNRKRLPVLPYCWLDGFQWFSKADLALESF